MPPKRRSPRDTAITNTRASKPSKPSEPTPGLPENSIDIVAVETDHGSDADLEATANILNLATKRKSTPHKPDSLFGPIGNIARKLFYSPKKDPNQPEEADEEADEEKDEQTENQKMVEASKHFTYIEPQPVTDPPAKRTLDQVSDVENPTEDDENPHKRGKTRGKGKRPLVAPRTSDGQNLKVVVRSLPENLPPAKPIKSTVRKVAKKSQRKNLEGRVARSKKTASPVTESHADDQESIPDQPTRKSSLRKSTTRGSAGDGTHRVPLVGPLDYEEGITEILMNPSPIKVTGPDTATTRKKAHSKSGPFLKGYESLSDDEEGDPVENGVEEDLEPVEDVVAQRKKENSIESTGLHSIAFDTELLDSLILKARRVGHTAKRGTKDFEDVSSVNKLTTQGGEKIHRRLDKLVKDYEKLQSSKSENDEEATTETRENIATNLQNLTDYATRIVTVKLNGKANGGMVMKLLRDLYFYILPNWLDLIKLASSCYDEEGSMTTLSLKQMHAHLKSWFELAESAISQPTNVQPKGGYQTSKPTREILPQIHKLRRAFQNKISDKSGKGSVARALKLRIEQERERLEDFEEEEEEPSTSDDEVQRLKLELAKVRREKEERAERAKRARINEIHRIQAEQVRQALEWQRDLDERAKEKVERGKRGRSKSRELLYRLVDLTTNEEEAEAEADDDDDDDDPFADDYQPRLNGLPASGPFADDYQPRLNGRPASVNLGEEEPQDDEGYQDEYQLERVEVFPHNNTSSTASMPWSHEQKLVFVNCMIRGGHDKYERAAEALQCSMDEVFAAAKELQEAHDRAHAMGQLNGPEDGWSYDVWVEGG